MSRGKEYKADLLADLENDRAYAAMYLSAALIDSKEAFLIALRDVAEAQQGIAAVAKGAGVNRESLYRTLSEQGNPRLGTLEAVLDTLGLALVVKESGPSTPNPPRLQESERPTANDMTFTLDGTASEVGFFTTTVVLGQVYRSVPPHLLQQTYEDETTIGERYGS